MATVKGTYTLKDTLTLIPCGEENPEFVNFTSGGNNYLGIHYDDSNISFGGAIGYIADADDIGASLCAYNYEAFQEEEIEIGWVHESLKTIDFGETEQTVSDEFYSWLVENTVGSGNTQINITKNGTTTLATAGKYCDRNIDVNVAVEGGGGTDYTALLEGSIAGEYVNENVTTLRTGAFSNCKQLTSVSLPNCTEFTGNEVFYSCEKMTAVSLPNLTIIADGSNVFYNAKELREINMPKLTTIGTTTQRMFQACQRAKKISMPLLGGTTIQAYTFTNCVSMETLILGGDTLNPLANTNAFTNAGNETANGLRIYVPDNLVDSYKGATNWSTLASKIKPMSELEE